MAIKEGITQYIHACRCGGPVGMTGTVVSWEPLLPARSGYSEGQQDVWLLDFPEIVAAMCEFHRGLDVAG
jgi:hypothetical protein